MSAAVTGLSVCVVLSISLDLNNEAVDTEAQTLTSSDEIALLGKPKLGELYKCAVRIKESKEFKVMQPATE